MSEAIEANITSSSVDLNKLQQGDVILIIINPSVIPDGTILYNKSVPTGKKMSGSISISGNLDNI